MLGQKNQAHSVVHSARLVVMLVGRIRGDLAREAGGLRASNSCASGLVCKTVARRLRMVLVRPRRRRSACRPQQWHVQVLCTGGRQERRPRRASQRQVAPLLGAAQHERRQLPAVLLQLQQGR